MPASPPFPDSQDPPGGRLQGLARELRMGSDAALGPWYELEFAVVHRLCAGFLGSRAEADDLAQDAMLHLADRMHLWDAERAYAPWRNTLVANLCRDRLRADARRTRHESAAAMDRPEAFDERDRGELLALDVHEQLERVLRWLSPREREVFVLVDLEGNPAAEAALQLDLAPSTVRAALTLARRKLRCWMVNLQPGAES